MCHSIESVGYRVGLTTAGGYLKGGNSVAHVVVNAFSET